MLLGSGSVYLFTGNSGGDVVMPVAVGMFRTGRIDRGFQCLNWHLVFMDSSLETHLRLIVFQKRAPSAGPVFFLLATVNQR